LALVPPAQTSFDSWLNTATALDATDLHLSAGLQPMVRVGGSLVPIDTAPVLDEAQVEAVARQVLGDQADQLDVLGDVDFSFAWGESARFRGNAFWQRGRVAISLRHIPTRVPTPDELGLPPVLDQFLEGASGLVIVTGPTGAGKTTTLASLIDQINRRRRCHIITLEEPIEYLHSHVLAMVNQREVGSDVATFAEGLRAALREDPDVLLVGEMRDIESIQATLTIAETGHLVFATLHTNDAAQAIDRIVDVFPADRRPQVQLQLAATLRAVVYQRLLPTLDGGQAAAFEVMIGTSAVANMVREGRSRQLRNTIATSQSDGMQTLEQSLTELVASGRVDYEVAAGASLHRKEVKRSVSVR
jgi:twitching motility protein PilT